MIIQFIKITWTQQEQRQICLQYYERLQFIAIIDIMT